MSTPRRPLAELKTTIDKKARRARLKSSKLFKNDDDEAFAPSLLRPSSHHLPIRSSMMSRQQTSSSSSETWSSSRDSDFMSCCDSGEFPVPFAQPSSPRFGSGGAERNLFNKGLSYTPPPVKTSRNGTVLSPDSGTPTAFAAIFHNRATSLLSSTANAAAESLRNRALPILRPPPATPRSVQTTQPINNPFPHISNSIPQTPQARFTQQAPTTPQARVPPRTPPTARSLVTVPSCSSSASESDSGLCGVSDAVSGSEPATSASIPVAASRDVCTTSASSSSRVEMSMSSAETSSSVRLTRKVRQSVAESLFAEFNAVVFDGNLPEDVPIVWNSRLRKTAGQAVFVRFDKESTSHCDPDDEEEDIASLMSNLSLLTPRTRATAHEFKVKRIDLAPKVLTTRDRLAKTLLHECCHLGQRLLEDNENDPPHGPLFRKWARRATSLYPQYEVSVRHSYEIHMPFRWECQDCKFQYSRGNKKSIDVNKHRCGQKSCRGRLLYLGEFREDGTPSKRRIEEPKGLSKYQEFVKARYPEAQQQAKTSKEIMALIAQWWRDEQNKNKPPQLNTPIQSRRRQYMVRDDLSSDDEEL